MDPLAHSGCAGPAENRQAVVVLGMHRSGTSACMHLLSRFGVRIDNDLLPANGFNEKGFFESRSIVELNDDILAALGLRWHSFFSLGLREDWLEDPALVPLRGRLAALLKERTAGPGMWGVKDPRLSVLAPLYNRVFAECGLEPRYVLCLRDPRSVASSLRRIHGFSPFFSEVLWMEYTLRAIRACGDRLSAVIQYEKWFTSGQEQLQALLGGLHFHPETGPTDRAALLASTFDAGLDHAEGERPFALACTESVYRLVKEGAYQGAEAEYAELRQALRAAAYPGTHVSQLGWRTEAEAFTRFRSAGGVAEIGPGRNTIRISFPPESRGLAGLRLSPVSQPGIARILCLRVLGPQGAVVWEWNGSTEPERADCRFHNIAFLCSDGPEVLVHFRDGNAAITLSGLGPDGTGLTGGGSVEFVFEWLVTSGLDAADLSQYVADQISSQAAAAEQLRRQLEAACLENRRQEAELQAAFRENGRQRTELEAVHCENGRREAELRDAARWREAVLRSWSWRLTAPLRAVAGFLVSTGRKKS